MRKSKKIPGRRLSIVPSSCAWVSCWFWIVMLHRSLGVLAKKHHPSWKGSKLQSQIAKDPICTNLSTRLEIQIFTDSWPLPTCEFNFDRENPMPAMPAHFFSLPGFSIMEQNFCHVFLLLFGYFCRWYLVLHFHLRLVWRRKKWRIWCCFEESIAVEERDLVQVGLPTGSGTILADLFPLYIRRFFEKIGW